MKRKNCLITLLGLTSGTLVLMLVLGMMLFSTCISNHHPYNQVTVDFVRPITHPRGAEDELGNAKALLAGSGGQIRAMQYYYEGGLFEHDLLGGPEMELNLRQGYGRNFAWEFGDRYGFLFHKVTGGPPPPPPVVDKQIVADKLDIPEKAQPRVETWRIVWFKAADFPIEGRSLLTGGGKVTFDMSQGQVEPLSEEEAEKLLIQLNIDQNAARKPR
jgi:hypothetical protein